MAVKNENIENLVKELEERAKELNCLYKIEDALNDQNISLPEAFKSVVKAIPSGWQYQDIARAMIIYKGNIYKSSEFEETKWFQ